MDQLNLFIVGGFLGSGKTTAISQAAIHFRKKGSKIAVITNDHGTGLVDSRLVKNYEIPLQQVTGGCFCCNYNELKSVLDVLYEMEQPDIIFAESVGSCTDLIATVINPLLTFHPDGYNIVLSIFADVRLLISFLKKRDIFSENVNYIYEKQLQEADILVVNKIDLLSTDQLEAAKELIISSFGDKTILYQTSFTEEDISPWLDTCLRTKNSLLKKTLELNYNVYGAGEAELGWLDEEIGIVEINRNAVHTGCLLMEAIFTNLKKLNYPIAHLKFILDNGIEERKVSYVTFSDNGDFDLEGWQKSQRVILLLNARVQTAPDNIHRAVVDAIRDIEKSTGCKITEGSISAFRPNFPTPTHRVSY